MVGKQYPQRSEISCSATITRFEVTVLFPYHVNVIKSTRENNTRDPVNMILSFVITRMLTNGIVIRNMYEALVHFILGYGSIVWKI